MAQIIGVKPETGSKSGRSTKRKPTLASESRDQTRPIPAYTSASIQLKLQMAAKMFPNEESKYRYVNEKMDKELVVYRKEIERRFNKGEMKNYQFLRVTTEPSSYEAA